MEHVHVCISDVSYLLDCLSHPQQCCEIFRFFVCWFLHGFVLISRCAILFICLNSLLGLILLDCLLKVILKFSLYTMRLYYFDLSLPLQIWKLIKHGGKREKEYRKFIYIRYIFAIHRIPAKSAIRCLNYLDPVAQKLIKSNW